MVKQAGLGGGCHWCTEAVFSSLNGVKSVQQGWIASTGDNSSFSEGVVIQYDENVISLATLIEVHLYTHSSTSEHSMRDKYRSAVYFFTDDDRMIAEETIKALQPDFDEPVITKVLPYHTFALSRDELLDYYYNDPKKPFCELYINPKLKFIMERFSKVVNYNKLKHLEQ